ncbi:MAG TPA: fumarylacetoacetate hydrolase family protein [Marinospirillum sp.]|uniref:fumarylacetoacetate hydrolase family protein n=1 Tax=Marinospirillum sp. TaxID=2183934 RepID=UPI002B492911|nr:fumarylacetoacetate hydrolase family protein [Marinospirillum sp.]HKM14633.1 fumarylacetoacetate hydrolase family protein [Marinospirillum sp.]
MFNSRLLGTNSLWPLGKIVCVGRNYAEHAAELNNPVPEQPLLFIKPATSAVAMQAPVRLPTNVGDVHYETEIALLIGQTLSKVKPAKALAGVVGVGLALDLTLRDLQSELKKLGHPWERAKAWDGACPLSDFVDVAAVNDWQALELSLKINGIEKQRGQAKQMLTPIAELLSHISQTFTLLAGDVVITGTPAGVGKLAVGDQLELALTGLLQVETRVI